MKLNFTKKRILFLLCAVFGLTINVHAQALVINTIVGNGNNGYNGDGIPAKSAEIANPVGTAFDAAGNLYIADGGHNRIRKVDKNTGIITTVAGKGTTGFSGDGGPADSATFGFVQDVVADAAGNLYIADGYALVRKVTASTGIITTIAGDGTTGYSGDGGLADTSSLNAPYAIGLDAAGNLYIAEYSNNRIRRVDAKTNIITTVAGNGNAGFSGDGGLATDAETYAPYGVAIDKAGNIYIGDALNSCVRKVNAQTGIITTIAGNNTYGYSGDGGAAVSAQLSGPGHIALDDSDNVYIADAANQRIRKVNALTGIITTFAGTGFDTSIYIVSFGKYETVGGFSGDGGPATDARFYFPSGMSFDPEGNFYICDWGNERVREVSAASTGVKQLLPNSDQVTVYPNPTNGVVTVNLSSGNYISVTVYDEVGREVYYKLVTGAEQGKKLFVNLSNSFNGIYFLQLLTDKGIAVKKIIVEK